MKIIVTDRETLKELEDDSALTIEGLAEDSIPDFIEWIKKYTPLIRETAYVIKGDVMNMAYGLTGNNAYQSDINIVAVKLSDMENYNAVVLPRFGIGGRWFDDIVDNNARREGEG